MAEKPVRYVPRELLDELHFRVLTPEQQAAPDSDERWNAERLLETAYARGYEEGYMRGITEGAWQRHAADQAARTDQQDGDTRDE